MTRELEVLRAEYERAVNYHLFNNPRDYCILLNLIQDRIDQIEAQNANN